MLKYREATAANVGKNQAELDKEEAKKYEDYIQDDSPVTREDLEKAATKKPESNSRLAEATVSVNLRLEPSLESEILCVLYPGIKVRVDVMPGIKDWYALTYQGRNCFVKKDFIKLL